MSGGVLAKALAFFIFSAWRLCLVRLPPKEDRWGVAPGCATTCGVGAWNWGGWLLCTLLNY